MLNILLFIIMLFTISFIGMCATHTCIKNVY